ncbi:PP2C family protein-serine/threonine phosphatase [Candidatus Oscillochloris fontis]|uniref:PP2C family protein-serine/threonine phosphatase n=1 Tax=Candidatus Oscillochloris fontis TaxID=2496868 RepID=UPI00101CC73C|nr:SpoIIE family protein phosphatase [Candidatus Oscillochloris fontis]
MLVALLSSQYQRFAAIAEAWLAQGASAFGVFQDGRPLIYWPSSHRLVRPSLTAPIIQDDQPVADLRVAGITGMAAEARLRADAVIISSLLQLEHDLQCMTADLVTSQDQQLALYRLSQSMRDHVTVLETLRSLVAEGMRMTKSHAGFAAFIPKHGQEPLLVKSAEDFLSDEMAWRIYWHTRSLEHAVNLPDPDADFPTLPDIEDLLAVPIRVRGSIMAGMAMANRPGGFGTPDMKLIQAIADQASAQIERMLLYQEMFDQAKLRTEMDLARRVQLDLLLRQLPQVTGLDIYATSRPAYQVGGDFFDFIVNPGRPFVFSLGDVTGKGLSAALLMTMTRSAIHSKAQFMPFPTPEAVMRQSNEDLYNDFTRVGVFATVFVGQYEPGTQRLLYANAGHAPVIYRPIDGPAQLLRADSTAIGILPVSHCRNQTLNMRPGDLLVVATDGFSDARNAHDETFDIERLIDLIDQLAPRTARDIADAMFETVDRFGGGRNQDDDQTLVVIKGAAS